MSENFNLAENKISVCGKEYERAQDLLCRAKLKFISDYSGGFLTIKKLLFVLLPSCLDIVVLEA